LKLREGLRRVVSSQGSVQPYEQGVVASVVAWSDGEPGMHEALPPGPVDPAGYEMRWWMPNGDDVAADVMVFASTNDAHIFFIRASSPRCRVAGSALATFFPPGGQNLAWRNPDGFAQEDLFLLRGRRVYRVVVVKAGTGASASRGERIAAFSLIDALACALPRAACLVGVSS
jgi:hypothetical protein